MCCLAEVCTLRVCFLLCQTDLVYFSNTFKKDQKQKSSVYGVRPKTSRHLCNNCVLVRFSLFSLHIWGSCGFRSAQEPRCHLTAWRLHAAWDTSASPPRLQPSAKALSTHTHHGGLLLRSGGRLRREVIVGSDSGGRCQASFTIRSLRSSCCIFYWGNKRTASYFHTRAISLRAAAKETRWG